LAVCAHELLPELPFVIETLEAGPPLPVPLQFIDPPPALAGEAITPAMSSTSAALIAVLRQIVTCLVMVVPLERWPRAQN
jgi:hypothetical protein